MVALLHDSVPDLAHCLWPSVDQQQCLLVFPAVCPSVTYTTAARAAVRSVTEPFPRAVKYAFKKKSKGIQTFSSNRWLHVQKEEAEFGRKNGEIVPWWLLMMKQKCCMSALCNIPACKNMCSFPLYRSHQLSYWWHKGVAIYISGFQQ